MTYPKGREESLNEFEDHKAPTFSQNDPNLYQKYKENSAHQRFQRSAEGVPAISVEDFKLLRDCNKESFYYRCLPLSAGIVALMYFIGNQKNMRPKAWHVLSGAFGGWFFGKLSYRSICQDRLVNSKSNSPFVIAMRRRRGIVTPEDYQPDSSMTSDAPPEATDPYWEQKSKTDAFGYAYGSNDYSEDFGEGDKRQKDEDLKSFTTYDDLRSKNRASYKPKPFVA